MSLSKPTNGSNADYANRIGLLFDAFNNGNYAFPATQVPSADANTLDDYEEGTWTPTLTFATPGDLSVTFGTRVGTYTKIGNRVFIDYQIFPSAFTHTTASGAARLSGLPYNPSASIDSGFDGQVRWSGITKANYTSISCEASGGTTYLSFWASGSGQSESALSAADMPTGGAVLLKGAVCFIV